MSMRKASIIAISGKQFSGKDQLTEILIKHLPNFTQIPLALAIKQAYGEKYGLSLDEIEANKAQHRPGLIKLGDWGRSQDPDYWLKQVLESSGNKIISDVRLKREYDLLKAQDAFLIRLEASREIRSQRGTLVSENDLTECDLDNTSHWDALLRNEGSIQELEEQLKKLL